MPRYDEGRGPWPRGWREGGSDGGVEGFRGGRAQEEPGGRARGGRGDERYDWLLSGPIYGPERYGLGPYHERLRRRRRPDDEVAHDVEEALFFDTWVDAEAITVEVRDGVVTLRGALPAYDEIRYATDDAWDVEGVLGVRSELTLRE